MQRRFLKQLCTITFFFLGITAFAGDFIKTSEGIIVRPDAPFGGGAKEVELKVISDK